MGIGAIDRLIGILERAKTAYLCYKRALLHEKRILIESLTSNRSVEGRNVLFELEIPFEAIANRFSITAGRPHRDRLRTWDRLIPWLDDLLEQNPSLGLKEVEDEEDDLDDDLKPPLPASHPFRNLKR